jgi:hypothetical protein
MKTLAVILFAFFISYGLTSQAQAFSLNPKSTVFTLSGPVTFNVTGVTINCSITMTGNVDSSGVGHITSVSVSGGGICPLVMPTRLPWTLTATGPTALTLSGLSFTITGLVSAGPGPALVSLSGGTLTLSTTLSGGLTVYSRLNSSTPLSISNP